MKERPILFSAPMVRAILAGTKTQTRRVVKAPAPANATSAGVFFAPGKDHDGEWNWLNGDPRDIDSWGWVGEPFRCPYGQPGDRLLVASEIPGVGRMYCAGTDGVIYSRARGDWRPLKAHLSDNGYPSVTLMLDGRKTTRAVHSLVCAAFYGPPPFDGAQVRHLNGDPQRNRPDNLCWGTQAENWQDRRAHGTGVDGQKHHAAKLTDEDRSHLRWAIERGLCSQHHAARILGMTQSAIGQVMQGSELRAVYQPDAGLRIPRITLEVTAVRVERLQDISEADAHAEGVEFTGFNGDADWRRFGVANCLDARFRHAFREVWGQINGPDAWDANPWAWVVEFRRLP